MRLLSVFIVLLAGAARLSAMEPELLRLDSLESRLARGGDTLYVVNFWATWCKPCVEELPAFEKAGKEFSAQPVKVLLVSLDFKSQLRKSVAPFVRRKNLQSEVYLLDEKDANAWIPRVDPEWSGAIPATLFAGPNGLRSFHEREFEYPELREQISTLLDTD